jgi:hypothetical protein
VNMYMYVNFQVVQFCCLELCDIYFVMMTSVEVILRESEMNIHLILYMAGCDMFHYVCSCTCSKYT